MIVILLVYFALFGAHFEKQAVATVLTLVIFLTAMSMYISNDAAIPRLGLPGKYSLASSELERNILAITAGAKRG
ncbi:MAG TPA: hypothetical protein VK888_10720 [Anaerolineales bacterium]|nr:hypothetical protein [Anaerolineales bacterium]